MKICILPLNSCVMRKQKIVQYKQFIVNTNHELVDRPNEADVTIVWTCAFRGDFKEASLTEIDYLLETGVDNIYVAGCLPEIDPESLRQRPEVTPLPWHEDKRILETLLGSHAHLDDFFSAFIEELKCEDAMVYRKMYPQEDVTFHDQFIKLVVSEGCNYNCSYCSEKLAFPPFRSVPVDALSAVCADVVARTGVTDVMLMADSLGQYGMDNGTNFPELIDELASISSNIKFAFNNYNPADALRHIDWLGRLISDSKIKHLNLPIQSASSVVLKGMNRPYTQEDIEYLFGTLRKLKFTSFDTHLIMGYPGETEDDVDMTIDFCLRHRPQYVLLSRYMESERAPSALLSGKVPPWQAMERIAKAQDQLSSKGIICNSDGSELSRERIKRLFREKRK